MMLTVQEADLKGGYFVLTDGYEFTVDDILVYLPVLVTKEIVSVKEATPLFEEGVTGTITTTGQRLLKELQEFMAIEWTGPGGEQAAVYKGKKLVVTPVGGEGEYDGFIDGERFCGTDDFDRTAKMLQQRVDGTYVAPPNYSGLNRQPQVTLTPR